MTELRMGQPLQVKHLTTGIDMSYKEIGKGEPVVLHYGTNGDHSPWAPQIATLSRHFRVIAPDPRGTGATRGAADEWSIGLFAEDLVALLDAMGIERAHLCGMSMGAAVCQEAAIRHPDRVKTLILSNTWARTDTRLLLLWRHSLFLFSEAARVKSAERGRWDEMIYRHGISMFFSSDALENRTDLIEEWWKLYSGGVREETGSGHWDAMLRHDVLDRLKHVHAPTLVIAGEEDYFTQYYPRQVHNSIANSTYACLEGPGSSHGLLWERADEANALISDFVKAHAA